MPRTLEIVRFHLAAGVDSADFLRHAARVDALLDATPGFLRRDLAEGDDGWTDIVHWATPEDAHAAAASLPAHPEAADFMAAIDPSGLRMEHLVLRASR